MRIRDLSWYLFLSCLLSNLQGYAQDVPDYSITTDNGELIITDLSGNGEAFYMNDAGGAFEFYVDGRTYAIDGGPHIYFPVVFEVLQFTSITINLENGDDQLFLEGNSSELPSLTINGGVNDDVIAFNGNINFLPDADLDIDLQNDVITPGTDAFFVNPGTALSMYGAGDVIIRASHYVHLYAASSLVTEYGNITLEANQQTPSTPGAYSGVDLNGTIEINAEGQLSIAGRGGDADNYQCGILIHQGASVIGGAAGMTLINGTGGTGPGFNNHGIAINDNSQLSTNGSDLIITGIGGAGTHSHGVSMEAGGLISANGAGNISVQGTATARGKGVFLFQSQITSAGGNISMAGTGGNANSECTGIEIGYSSEVAASMPGTVLINGTGGNGENGQFNHGVYVHQSSMVTSEDGFVSISGQGGQYSELANGVMVETAGMISSGGQQALWIAGTGGNGSIDCIGVCVGNGGRITTEGGTCNIFGTGGTGSISYGGCHGMMVEEQGMITTGDSMAGATLSIYGNGGMNADVGANHGIFIDGYVGVTSPLDQDINLYGNSGSSGFQSAGVLIMGEVEILGNGQISINGNGCTCPGDENHGVYIWGGLVTAPQGSIQVSGIGGNTLEGLNGGNRGVYLREGGRIINGTGSLQVFGQGGLSNELYNVGIEIASFGHMSSHGPALINGIGGGVADFASGYNHGIYLHDVGNTVTHGIFAEGTGSMLITGVGGHGLSLSNHGVYLGGANARVQSMQSPLSVLGTAGGEDASFNHGVYITDEVDISGLDTFPVYIQGMPGMSTGNQNMGVLINDDAVIHAMGDIEIEGEGGHGTFSYWNYGVMIGGNSEIMAADERAIQITGTGGSGDGGHHVGVYLQNTGNRIEGYADVVIEGHGGDAMDNGGSCDGVRMEGQAVINVYGDATASIFGFGGETPSPGNNGIQLLSGAQVISEHGDIIAEGYGGGSAFSSLNHGVYVQGVSGFTSFGQGDIDIYGEGGSMTGNSNTGIWVQGGQITAGLGSIQLEGIGGAGNGIDNRGLVIDQVSGIQANEGEINLIGSGGMLSGAESHGIELANSSWIFGQQDVHLTGESFGAFGPLGFVSTQDCQVTSGLGDVMIESNSVHQFGGLWATTEGTVSLHPIDAGVQIHLGYIGDGSGGPLNLIEDEIANVAADTLVIGTDSAGTFTVEIDFTLPDSTTTYLRSGEYISLNSGPIQLQGQSLYLHAGDHPYGIRPVHDEVDVIADTLYCESTLIFHIVGTVPDVEYDRLVVNGVVDIAGIDLLITGNLVLYTEEIFTLIDNDGTDPVIGQFNGLAEGDTVPPGIYNMTVIISYVGGTGNDVVLIALPPCTLPDIPVLTGSPDTICAGAPITLQVNSGNLGDATQWHWYVAGCGGISAGIGNSIVVNPLTTSTYYARGEGACVTSGPCGQITVVVNPAPNPAIDRDASGPCYYTDNIFQPQAPVIPGATYQWNFGANAVPPAATGYGPHTVIYTDDSVKTVKLVIHPNAPGANCPDSSTLTFTINTCPGQILGKVVTITGAPMTNVNVKLFHDVNADGVPDPGDPVKNVFTPPTGQFAMASLLPGHYVIVQTQPNLWLSYDDGDETADGDVVPNTDSLDNRIPVTVSVTETDSMNVFVERPDDGGITGSVFEDFDADQIPDPGEGLAGVVLSLYADANTNGVADNGIAIDTAHTNATGVYVFQVVAAGHYVLVETNPAGMNSVKDFDASPDGDAVPNSNMNNDTIPVSIGPAELDAGNFFIDVTAGCPLTVTNDNDDGPGSLRYVIDCAGAGDTILFHASLSGDTIEISSDALVIDQDVMFRSTVNPTVTIRSSINDLIEVTPGVVFTMQGLHLISGLSPGDAGAAINNFGSVYLQQITIRKNPLLPPTALLVKNHSSGHLEIIGQVLILE